MLEFLETFMYCVGIVVFVGMVNLTALFFLFGIVYLISLFFS